jgi:phage terminase small subunit
LPTADLSALVLVPPTSFEDSRFTAEERAYIYWRGCGLTPAQALRRSGFPALISRFDRTTRINQLESNPKVREAVQRIFEENRVRYDIDRDRVVEGLLEAINVAKEQSDSTAMINGWKELAKVTGVGAPERKEIVLTQTNPSTEALKQAPDDELLKLLGKERSLALTGPIEDAEYEVVPNETASV